MVFYLIEIEIKWQRFFILFFLIQSPIKSDDNKMTHHFVTKATQNGKKRWHLIFNPPICWKLKKKFTRFFAFKRRGSNTKNKTLEKHFDDYNLKLTLGGGTDVC